MNPILTTRSVRDEESGASVRPVPQWLVSVRDLSEAKVVANYGVDIVDLKEPSKGPLSPVSAAVWKQTVDWTAECSTPIPLSAALGEFDQAIEIAAEVPSGFSFAKMGASDAPDEGCLGQRWRRVKSRLPEKVELVAVAYADHRSASSIAVQRVFALASRLGISRVLIDTFDKSGPGVFEELGIETIIQLGIQARRSRLWWAIAGKLNLLQWGEVREAFVQSGRPTDLPDCVGVRGDVCTGNRAGAICPNRLQAWSSAIENR